MHKKLNFKNQFYPGINELQSWTDEIFYPYLKKLEQRKDTFRIYQICKSSKNDEFSVYRHNDDKPMCFKEIKEELSYFNKKVGLYGVSINYKGNCEFIYIGKNKNLSNRVRQHITSKNKDGTILSKSVSTKYNNIVNLVNDSRNFRVQFFVWTNKELDKYKDHNYYLVVLETLVLKKVKKEFNRFNSEYGLQLNHWNLRIG